MAGRRRDPVADTPRAPTSETKARNRRTAFLQNLAKTRALRPNERVTAVQAYFRSTLEVLDHRKPAAANALANEVFDQLAEASERAWAALGVKP